MCGDICPYLYFVLHIYIISLDVHVMFLLYISNFPNLNLSKVEYIYIKSFLDNKKLLKFCFKRAPFLLFFCFVYIQWTTKYRLHAKFYCSNNLPTTRIIDVINILSYVFTSYILATIFFFSTIKWLNTLLSLRIRPR